MGISLHSSVGDVRVGFKWEVSFPIIFRS
jgi:hypothetical protein